MCCSLMGGSNKGSHRLPNWMFFYTLCKRPLTPPPLGFTRSCCGFFWQTVKKCVNIWRDIVWQNSAFIGGENFIFTLKLWQFYPHFVTILLFKSQFYVTISSLKVIIVMFWIEFDFIVHLCLLLHAGDYHGVLDCVGMISIFVCLHSVVSCPKNSKKCSEYVPWNSSRGWDSQ